MTSQHSAGAIWQKAREQTDQQSDVKGRVWSVSPKWICPCRATAQMVPINYMIVLKDGGEDKTRVNMAVNELESVWDFFNEERDDGKCLGLFDSSRMEGEVEENKVKEEGPYRLSISCVYYLR